jgi:hypothetical protein
MNKNLFVSILLVGAFLCLMIPLANMVSMNTSRTLGQVVITGSDNPAFGSGSNAGAAAQSSADVLPLDDFSKTMNVSKSGTMAAVYVPNLFAYKIVQQPASDPTYVSPLPETTTNFGPAAQYGTIGLVAHNYLAGAMFSKLGLGTIVDIVNSDGAVRKYSVTDVAHFQALSPNDPYSSFVDLEKGARLSSNDLFSRMYMGGNKVVMQTCISAQGISSWGRLFVTATPAQ